MSNFDNSTRPPRPTDGRFRAVAWVAIGATLTMLAACKQDARLADADLREPVVADVTIAGLTLDEDATPQMVTYALLQAIREDIEAGKDIEARERALDKQFALAAPSTIHRHHIGIIGSQHADFQECVYLTVNTWAPTLGHYVGSFDFAFEKAKERMQVKRVSSPRTKVTAGMDEVHVLLEAEDPGGDPNASVVVKVRLVREEERWRVWWVGFERSIRRLPDSD